MRKMLVLLSLVAIACLCGVITMKANSAAQPNQKLKKARIIEQISGASASPIYADNSQGSDLYIREAGVKEITGDEFTALTAEASGPSKQTTHPQATLFNQSQKTIRAFALTIQSVDKPKSGRVLIKQNLSIAPGETFEVTPNEWLRAEQASVEEGGKFTTRWQQPGLDSAKSWLPCAASDLRITVAMVEYTDGTRWVIPTNSDW